MILTIKQTIALDYLEDSDTTEICFGGGAGGGKSALSCYYLLKNCFKYQKSRYLMGRAKLKTLKETTLKTFFEVMQMQGIGISEVKYNDNSHRITIRNGSEIFLKDLFFYPADPEYDELGSLELTGAIVDEASQVALKAKNILKSRLRFKLDEFDLLPKLLFTTNPTRGWIYDTFYKPYIENSLPEHRKYIQALHSDNPYLTKDYAETLDSLDDISRNRLKLGDWDYLDDPSILVDHDSVNDLFTNDHVKINGNKRLSADLAMQGRDKFIVTYMNGGILKIVKKLAKTTGKEIELTLRGLMTELGVGHSNVVADSDGMGQYLDSYIKNIYTFHGNATPINNTEFNNLKSQCGFKLAEVINKREIKIECSPEEEEEIKRQILNCLKRDNIDADDGKKKLISKQKMKELLGCSPDIFDSILMQMVFYLRSVTRGGVWRM